MPLFPVASNLCLFLSALRFRQDRNQSIRKPPEKSKCWMYVSVFSFPSQGETRSSVFSLYHNTLSKEREYGEWVPWIFLPGSMHLVSPLPGEQVPLNWFLDFSQTEFGLYIIVEFVSPWVEGVSGTYALLMKSL